MLLYTTLYIVNLVYQLHWLSVGCLTLKLPFCEKVHSCSTENFNESMFI
jgi:hypothetical protein